MHSFFKHILDRLGIYHPLQSAYRAAVDAHKNKKYRRQYEQYRGGGYTCNVCGMMYRQFVPDHPRREDSEAILQQQVIAGYGENIMCPNCMSTARERLVIAYLNDEVDVSDKKVLHLSPEKNVFAFIRQKASVTTADLSPGFYRTIDKNIRQEDATRLGFADNSFDIVIANHILEHIPNDRQAMKEIFRVLKPLGNAILQVPYSEQLAATLEDANVNDPTQQSRRFGQKDHVRIYALHDYMKRLEEAGFIVNLLGEARLHTYAKFATQPHEKFFRISKPAAVARR